MHTSRGVVYYCGSLECISEHVYIEFIQHEVHTTRLYNTPTQHTNRKIKRKRKNRFYWGDKRSHIYPDRVSIEFILAHKTNKWKEEVT